MSDGDAHRLFAELVRQTLDPEGSSDASVGGTMLAWMLADAVEARGGAIGQTSVEEAKFLLNGLFQQEALNVQNVALEKAFRIGAAGDFVKAGAIFRDHFSDQLARETDRRWLREALDELRSGRLRQSAAARCPRPKRHETHRSLAIRAMKRARKTEPHRTLDEFISSTEGGNRGLVIRPANLKGVQKWVVEADDLAGEKSISRSTLEGWWTHSAP